MTINEWDLVIKVHLRGHFMYGRAAARYFRAHKDQGGAIVNTTSTSGLLGNAGQINYAAAKLGIVGLNSSALNLELGKYCRVNSIAPMAYTRMTSDLAIRGNAQELQARAYRPARGFPAFRQGQSASPARCFGVFGPYVQLYRLPRPVSDWKADGLGWDPAKLAEKAAEMIKAATAVNWGYMPGTPIPEDKKVKYLIESIRLD